MNKTRGLCLSLVFIGALLRSASAMAEPPVANKCSRPLRMHISDIWVRTDRADAEWLQKVFERAGCVLLLQKEAPATYSRILRGLETGQFDVTVAASMTDERKRYLYFSFPYVTDHSKLYVRKQALARWRDQDLLQMAAAGAVILGPDHGWYGPQFEQFRQRYRGSKTLLTYRHDNESLAMFFNGSADALVSTERVLAVLASPEQRAQLVGQSTILLADPIHVVFSKKSVMLTDFQRIDHAIREMVNAGEVTASARLP